MLFIGESLYKEDLYCYPMKRTKQGAMVEDDSDANAS